MTQPVLPGMGGETRRESAATFSGDGRYRYRLSRRWSDALPVCFLMLNPSTADGHVDDPTIRRCMAFARRWGFGGLEVTNLFALRSTDPAALLVESDPIGPENDDAIWSAALLCHAIVVAWGAHRLAVERGREVAERLSLLHQLSCLGTTKAGAPRHPLYVRGDQARVLYRGA